MASRAEETQAEGGRLAPRARRGLGPVPAPVAVALGVRLLAALLSARLVADVLRYSRVGAHVLDVSWNPYLSPRLYPYPPVWVWFEAGSLWLSRQLGEALFPVLVKLPVLAADGALVLVLLRWAGPLAAWVYALHPVAVLVSGFHGQFDALALLLLLLSVRWAEEGRRDRSALGLAAAIAVKSFPVLLLGVLLSPGRARAIRYAALATVPVALILVPYALHDPAALRRELFGYGGVADFGWMGAGRGLRWLAGAGLWRSEARHWPLAVAASKALFGVAYGALLVLLWRGRVRLRPAAAAQAVVLCFLFAYGAGSAQYLLWAVPLGAVLGGRSFVAYSAAATLGLVGFYLFLAPGVLLPAPEGSAPAVAGVLWVGGAVSAWVASGAWLGAIVAAGMREGRS